MIRAKSEYLLALLGKRAYIVVTYLKEIRYAIVRESKSKTLTKTLGAFDLTMLGIGAIIGTGVLVLTGLVAARDAGQQLSFHS